MAWITMVYCTGCVIIIAAVSFWLRSKMLRRSERDSLWVQLAVVGFALITSGTALQLNHPPTYPDMPVMRLLDSFGSLFVVAGMIVLFILFCLSRGMAVAGKPITERENSMGEYLR